MKKLYRCEMVLYVAATCDLEAKIIAHENVNNEDAEIWEATEATLPLEKEWRDALPYGYFDDKMDGTRCREWMENQ